MTLPHSALAPSGQPIWLDMARRSARALVGLAERGLTTRDILTDAVDPQRHDRPRRVRRLDEPAAAHPGHRLRRRPAAADGRRLARDQRQGPAPGRASCPTARSATRPSASSSPAASPRSCSTCGDSACSTRPCLTATGEPLGRVLDWWEAQRAPHAAPRPAVRAGRRRSRRRHHEPRAGAASTGLTSTVTFPRGNLAPEGSVIKSTAIDPTRRRPRRRLPQDRPGARLHPRARRDRRDQGAGRRTRSRPGDVLVLIGRGPMGAGMEEIYQITVGPQAPVVRQAGRRADRRPLLRRLDRRLHRPRRPRGPRRRPDRQGPRRRPDPDRRRPHPARRDASTSSAADGSEFGAGRRARASSPRARRTPTSRPTPSFPTTPASGPPCRPSAAAPGAAASTTPTRSSPRSGPGHDLPAVCVATGTPRWMAQGCAVGSSTPSPSATAAALRSRSDETRVTGPGPAN